MDIRTALHNAVMQLLRPLVRVLLRHGMAYDEFTELARRAYVDVAQHDFTLQGRKQTTSRISVITGLNRKEVARLQLVTALNEPAHAEQAHTMNRAARVVAGWMQEHRGADGNPAALGSEQFAALVRTHSGDMPARAVLDELRHAGAVTVTDDGLYQLGRDGYGPKATDARKISLLGQHAADLLGAIEHNLSHPPEQAYLQQRVFADHIPADRIDAVRAALRETGQHTLAEVRNVLIGHDAGDTPVAPGARRVTLGLYYFEQAAAPALEPAATLPTPPHTSEPTPAAHPTGAPT